MILTPKFPIGAKIVVKSNLTLRGKIIDSRPPWVGATGIEYSANYDVVLDGDKYTRSFSEGALVLESAVFSGEPDKRDVSFSDRHLSRQLTSNENCQLFLAITGSKEHVYKKLLQIAAECKDSYGKPRQCICLESEGSTDIITPIWEGKKY